LGTSVGISSRWEIELVRRDARFWDHTRSCGPDHASPDELADLLRGPRRCLPTDDPGIRRDRTQTCSGHRREEKAKRAALITEILERERVKGIEPSPKAWEAFVLPLNYTREWTLGWRRNNCCCQPLLHRERRPFDGAKGDNCLFASSYQHRRDGELSQEAGLFARFLEDKFGVSGIESGEADHADIEAAVVAAGCSDEDEGKADRFDLERLACAGGHEGDANGFPWGKPTPGAVVPEDREVFFDFAENSNVLANV
jgi:hypothetical protein